LSASRLHGLLLCDSYPHFKKGHVTVRQSSDETMISVQDNPSNYNKAAKICVLTIIYPKKAIPLGIATIH